MAREQTLEFISGNDVEITLTVDNEATPTPAAKDLTGATEIIFVVAKTQGKPGVLTKTLGSGIAITDAPNGVMVISLAKVDTEPLGTKHTYHETRVKDAAGKTATVSYGPAVIAPNSITT